MKKNLLILIIIIAILFLCLNFNSEAKTAEKIIDVVTIDNYTINPVIANFIIKAIDKANENKSICLIIQLDTPGGLLEATRNIVKSILNSKVPIVVYIAPSGSRAGSAGVFITYASHIAAMAPSTNIGAAHPVGVGVTPSAPKKELTKEEDKEETDIMSKKIINDTVAWITAIAKYRGRNIKWAKKAVTESVSITEDEALKRKVINLIAEDLNELILKLDNYKIKSKDEIILLKTKNATLNFIYPSTQQKILNSIAHPFVAYILMLLGIMGLIFEFTHPGIGFPGIAGFICLLLALFAFQLFPVNYLGFIFIILAIVLFIAEAFTPTFGLLTLGGLVSLTLGSLMLMKVSDPFLFAPLRLIIPAALTTAAIVVFLVWTAAKSHRKKVITGKEGLIGEEAETLTKLNPYGKVFCHGEIWNAVSENKKTISKNETVKIVEVKRLTLIVKKSS
jgi:membrane-bound serine protease (ClpP class)